MGLPLLPGMLVAAAVAVWLMLLPPLANGPVHTCSME